MPGLRFDLRCLGSFRNCGRRRLLGKGRAGKRTTTTPTIEEVTASEAAAWLSTNEHDEDDAEKAGPEVASAYAALELA